MKATEYRIQYDAGTCYKVSYRKRLVGFVQRPVNKRQTSWLTVTAKRDHWEARDIENKLVARAHTKRRAAMKLLVIVTEKEISESMKSTSVRHVRARIAAERDFCEFTKETVGAEQKARLELIIHYLNQAMKELDYVVRYS